MTIKGENIGHVVINLNIYIKQKSKMEEIEDLIDYAKGFAFADLREVSSNKETRIRTYAGDALDIKDLSAEELVAILPIRLKYHTRIAIDTMKRLYEDGISIDLKDRVKDLSFKDSLEIADKRDEENLRMQDEIKKSNDVSMRALLDQVGS